jgi:hypothetical protein
MTVVHEQIDLYEGKLKHSIFNVIATHVCKKM